MLRRASVPMNTWKERSNAYCVKDIGLLDFAVNMGLRRTRTLSLCSFYLYIDDLVNEIVSAKILLYADNIKIFMSVGTKGV